MTHRALEVLRAIEAAGGGDLSPGWKPDETATVLSYSIEALGEPAPDILRHTNWRLTVYVDLYVYELESNWLDILFERLAESHRVIMNDSGPGNTYDGLGYVVAAWLGPTEEPDIDTSTERTHAYQRAEFFVDFRSNPVDPEA